MAIEKDEGSKGSLEAKPAVSPAPPAVDEEKVALKNELATAQNALREVGDMVKSGKLRLHEEQARPVVDEDESALIDRKELKKTINDLKGAVAGAITEQSAYNARLARNNTKELIRGKLEDFDEHEKEVDALLDKMDPRVAAMPDTIKEAYNVVYAKHVDSKKTKIADRVRQQVIEELRAKGVDIPEDEEPEEPETPRESGRIAGSLPSSPRTSVAPAGDASVSRLAGSRRTSTTRQFSRDEKNAMSIFKLTPEEFVRYGDKSWKPDILGAKGRDRF